MDAILHLPAHGNLPGAPIAYRQGDQLYVFAGSQYQGGIWLVRYRQGFSHGSAALLSRRLSSSMRSELIRRYDPRVDYAPGRFWSREIDGVRDLLLRARVKAYRLSAREHLHRLYDPADPLLAPLQRPPAPSFAQAPTPALQAARFDLADELGQILIARWRSKDAFDGAFWDEPVWTRALILLGGSLHAVGEAADSAWQGLVELARFGRLVVQQVGEGLQLSLEKAAALSGADFHAAAQALQRLGLDGIDSVQALYAQAERGLEMLHALLADPPSAALLSDFLLGYAHSMSYVEQRTGVVKTVAVIGIEVLIALAAGAVSLGVGTAVASARLAQRIGPFTAKAIELLRELYDQLRAFRSHEPGRIGNERKNRLISHQGTKIGSRQVTGAYSGDEGGSGRTSHDNASRLKAPGFTRFGEGYDQHIVYRDLSVPRRRGIGGAHNKHEFLMHSGEYEIVEVVPHPVIEGVEVIRYRMAALDSAGNPTGSYRAAILAKTVYDPLKISDEEFLAWGRQAAAAAQSAGKLNREWVGVSPNGLEFRGYLDHSGAVKTFFPNF